MSSGGQLPVGTTFPNHARLGVEGTFLTSGQARGYGITKIDPTGPAGPAGLLEGDVIEKVAGKSAKDDNSLTEGLAKAAKKPTYTVDVIRSGKPLTLTFLRAFHPPVTSQVEATAIEATNAVAPIPQPSIADELEKLAKLRDQHILTNEEFEKRKIKLLAQ